MATVYNDFLEHAMVSTTDPITHLPTYELDYPHTTMFYYNSKQARKEYLDIDEVIFDEDVEALVSDLKKASVNTFTYSYEYGANQSFAKIFEDNGYKQVGVHYYKVEELSWQELDDDGNPTQDPTQIPSTITKTIPAYKFTLSS